MVSAAIHRAQEAGAVPIRLVNVTQPLSCDGNMGGSLRVCHDMQSRHGVMTMRPHHVSETLAGQYEGSTLGHLEAQTRKSLHPYAPMQVVVTLGISALGPFANPPRLNLGYTLGAGGGAVVSESLALPAVSRYKIALMPIPAVRPSGSRQPQSTLSVR